MTNASAFTFKHDRRDVFQRHVGRVRPRPTSPTDVVADAIRRKARECRVQCLGMALHPGLKVLRAYLGAPSDRR